MCHFDVKLFRKLLTKLLLTKSFRTQGDAIAQLIRLRLPYCGHRFESQADHLCFNSQILDNIVCTFRKGRK